jgi:hypothetical protein
LYNKGFRMAPVGSHRKSFDRAAKAFELRAKQCSWQEVADQLGFRSRQGAQQAVRRLIRNQSRDLVTERALSVERARMRGRALQPRFDEAVAEGDDETAVMISKHLAQLDDFEAKLQGTYAAVKVENQHNVQITAVQIITEAKQRLLDVIDAEVVEVGEIER